MTEIATILVPLLGGGAVGALLNEWFRRRRSRVQSIPLIERVNRLVSPELQGFTLARIVGSSAHRALEEVNNLRDYQLTIRNTSSTHLRDVEVQFEFPADDVQAWVTRPALSKTALVPVNTTPAEPWRRAFRWRIPHFPSGDSVELTFQAVDASSEKYEAALYQCEGVVFERVVGEPPPQRGPFGSFSTSIITVVLSGCLAWILSGVLYTGFMSGQKVNPINVGGCELQVLSMSSRYGQDFNSPWQLRYRISNVGAQACVIQSEKMGAAGPVTILAGDVLERETIVERAPKMQEVDFSAGTVGSDRTKTTALVYAAR